MLFWPIDVAFSLQFSYHDLCSAVITFQLRYRNITPNGNPNSTKVILVNTPTANKMPSRNDIPAGVTLSWVSWS